MLKKGNKNLNKENLFDTFESLYQLPLPHWIHNATTTKLIAPPAFQLVQLA